MQELIRSLFNRQSHYRLQTFTEQLIFARKDFVEYEISLKKLGEFHAVLKQQDRNNLNRLSRISLQLVDLQKRYKISEIFLREGNEELIKLKQMRSMFARMVIRRGNLCQLLYQKLTRSDRDIHRYERNMQMINRCIKSLIYQLQQIRNENEKILQRKEQSQFEVNSSRLNQNGIDYSFQTVKAHANRILDHSHQKQQVLIEQIFQRHSSIDRLPTEEISYLQKKYDLLKTRLIKMIFRGMIGNLVLLAIQQEFAKRMEVYRSPSNRKNQNRFNYLRANLRQIMRQLKWKSAELNMLIDYQYGFILKCDSYVVDVTSDRDV